jgi:hypothetical protein
MKLAGMESGVGEKYFPGIFSRRVMVKGRLYVSPDASD